MEDNAFSISMHGNDLTLYTLLVSIIDFTQFQKHLVDDWNHSIPYCRKVQVYALEEPDTASFINYPVLVKGTTEENISIVIQERLQATGIGFTVNLFS